MSEIRVKENESLEGYFEKTNKDESKMTLPNPQSDWDKDNLDEIFENINKEYKIYDSHNPKV